MADLNEAYAILSDPEQRAAYDARQRRGFRTAPAASPSAWDASLLMRFAVTDFRSPIYAISVSQNSRRLAVATFDNRVRILQARDGRFLAELLLPGASIEALRWVKPGRIVAAGASEKMYGAWEIRNHDVIRLKGRHAEWVSHLDIAPKGDRLALGSVHRTLMVVITRTGEPLYVRRRHRDAITAVRYSNDGRWIATGSNDHQVILWDARTGYEVAVFGPFPTSVNHVAFSNEDALLAVGLVDHTVRIIRIQDAVILATFRAHERTLEQLCFHPKAPVLASAARDGRVRLWDATTGARLAEAGPLHGPIKALAFSPGGKRLFIGSLGKQLYGYDVQVVKRT
jgi:WD40 repeat protein